MNSAEGFCIWMTGLPASGKSSITAVLAERLRKRDLPLVVLESDVMRKMLTPNPSYTPGERDRFYETLAALGALITHQGNNVIIDATANRRSYRDRARNLIRRFAEVYVQCPLEVCMQRDPKGIYHQAVANHTGTVPGLQEPYEPPSHAEVVLDCRTGPDTNADVVIEKLHQLLHI